MKRIAYLLLAALLALSVALPTFAVEGNVNYSGDAGSFIFAPGSDYSPTDLFPEFKDVMPGDSLTQTIVFKNDASKKVKINVFIRALGAHEDSVEFLSQMRLRVEKTADNSMDYMFDAAAHESAQLSDWVFLGTLYSGGEIKLNVILDVPVEMDNNYQKQVGYLDWEFMIEEHAISADDPEPPKTGDEFKPVMWAALACGSMFLLILLPIIRKKKEKEANG